MVPFTYRCPRTGQQVQGWAAADLGDSEAYEPVTCTACGRVHLVNPRTGKVLETAKKALNHCYKLRQLGDVRRDSSRLRHQPGI